MNDRTRGRQLPRQQTGMWVAEDREEIKERGPSQLVGSQITIIVIKIKVMANHLMPEIVLSVFPGLSHLTRGEHKPQTNENG